MFSVLQRTTNNTALLRYCTRILLHVNQQNTLTTHTRQYRLT